MPNRIIRDGWTDSEPINSLTDKAEIFFLRLCLKADDFGRFHAHPLLLKSACFPLKESVRVTDIDRWLAECEKAVLVRLYEVSGKRFVSIYKFGQRVRAEVSKFPPPPDDGQVSDRCPSSDGLGGGVVEDEGESECGKAERGRAVGFPSTVEEAVKLAELQPYPKEFVIHAWQKADSRGGCDSRDVPIRKWLSYLAIEWKYDQERKAKEKHGNNRSAGRQSPDRNAGTFNAGKASQYRNMGKVG